MSKTMKIILQAISYIITLLIVSSIALVAYQLIEIDNVASGPHVGHRDVRIAGCSIFISSSRYTCLASCRS